MLDQAQFSDETHAVAVFGSAADLAGLGLQARRQLAAMISGTIPGNKDRGIYALCAAIQDAGRGGDLGTLLDPQQRALPPILAAFLNYLATVGSPEDLDLVETQCLRLGSDRSEAVRKSAVSALAALLYRHRLQAFATEAAWGRYQALRRFLAQQGRSNPCDTDALTFWHANPDANTWGQIRACVHGFIDLDLSLQDKGVIRALHQAEDLSSRTIPEAGLSPLEAITPHEDTLGAALEFLETSPIKPFKRVELATMDVLFSLGCHAKTWPQSTDCRLRFATLQSILVQAQRDGTLGRMNRASMQDRLQPSASLFQTLHGLSLHCKDLLNLALLLQPELAKTRKAPAIDPDSGKRIEGFRRRAAIRDMPEADLIRHLMKLVPALADVTTYIDSVQKRLKAVGADTIKQNEALFLNEVSRRYGLERTEQNG